MPGRFKGLVIPAILLVLAELLIRIGDVQSNNIAPPSAVLVALVGLVASGKVFVATGQTLLSALTGLAIGGTAGLMLGTILGLSRPVSRLMSVSLEFFRPIPSVALIPIALLAFGFGYKMEIAIVAFATFWPMLIYCRGAVEGVERQLLEVARILNLSKPASIRKIVLPAALPQIFVALRTAAAIALIIAVTTEILSNPQGLGFAVMNAQMTLHPDVMLANIFWLGLVGLVLNGGLLWAQRNLFGKAARGDIAR